MTLDPKRDHSQQQPQLDPRDLRHGAYDAVNEEGRPQSDQVTEANTPHERAQPGADVRAQPLPSTEAILPDGLRRERMGPYSRNTGRRTS